jgi:RNA polymerase-interacting CarD/CdnL/TRCF family regulator
MSFKIGDRVVHPRHGLGHVKHLAVKQFVQGEKRPFYEISFPDSTLWVPFNLSTSGIRKLTGKSEIASCRSLLKSPATALNADPRLRQKELSDHLKLGTLTAHCEVVRDLAAHGWNKPLGGAMSAFLKATQDVLCQEWAEVEGISLEQASEEVESLLEIGKQANFTR